jgi:hypothetical protein
VLWGNSDNCSCQAPEVYPSIYLYIPVYTCMSLYALIIYMFIPACPHRESQDCGKPD